MPPDEIPYIDSQYFFQYTSGFFLSGDYIAILNSIISFFVSIRVPALISSILLIAFIIHLKREHGKLEKEENKLFNVANASAPAETKVNGKWLSVERHINSSSPNDWRMAIVEADIMLGDVLQNAGYRGDTIGEKLKGVEPSDMLTLDEAWEAHKARNLIAHQGSNYELNEREARRIIGLYKKVFEEYFYI